MNNKSSLHRRFEEAKQKAKAAVVAHGEASTETPPIQELPVVVTEDLDANVLATGPLPTVMIEPNPDNAKAAASAYEELETKLGDRLGSEFETAKESLRELRDNIALANAQGGFSPECAYFAAIAVEAHTDRIGLMDEQLTASFESAFTSPEGKLVVSTESLDNALEGVDNVGKQMVKRTASTLLRTFINFQYLARRWIGPLTKLNTTASKFKSAGVQAAVTINVPSKLIMEGDHPSTNLAESFTKASEILRFMIVDFAKQAKMDFKSNADTVFSHVDYEKKTEAEAYVKVADMPDILSKWKDPRHRLGQKGSLPLIGNFVLFEDHELKYHGNDGTAKKFDALANLDYPTLAGFAKSNDKPAGDVSKSVAVKPLTPDEVIRLSKSFTETIKAIGFWRSRMEETAAMLTPIAFPIKAMRRVEGTGTANAAGTDVGNVPELKTLKNALETSSRLRFHVSYDAVRILTRIARNFYKVASLSLKANGKAAVESWDQNSATDGVSVNETSPIEPTMAPAAKDQAPPGEVLPHQSTFQDQPDAKQDLNGAIESESPVEDLSKTAVAIDEKNDGTVVVEVQAATANTAQEVTEAKLAGSAPTGVTLPAATAADEHADGTPVAAVEPAGQDVEAVVKEATLTGTPATGVTLPAAADADKHADDATGTVIAVHSPKVHTATESHGAGIKVPYWYKPEKVA